MGVGQREPLGTSIEPALSASARFVAFESDAPNLVGGDTNDEFDVFVRDRRTARTQRISVASSGVQANGRSHLATISANGRFVAFESLASNLVRGDTNGSADIFVHDRRHRETTTVSVSATGTGGNGASTNAWISADGRVVAFQSDASNLARGDTNGVGDIFLHDRTIGVTSRVSVSSRGVQANDRSLDPVTSSDGRWVAFTSDASNLTRGDTNQVSDVFVHDRRSDRMGRVSVSSTGAQGDAASLESEISPDGQLVAFSSFASNLVDGDTNGSQDVFVHARKAERTDRISVSPSGAEGNDRSRRPGYFAGTRFVAFQSFASNLVSADTNGVGDAFVHDRRHGRTRRVSVDPAGAEGNCLSAEVRVSADGRFAAFASCASNLVDDDVDNRFDVFLHGPLRDGQFLVRVRPRSGRVGERTCYRFRVRNSVTEYAVGGASIRLDGKTERTDTRGRARICTTFRSRGLRTARVTKHGFRPKRHLIRIL